ncbi:MAG: transcriptional regulator [Chitinophagia bacterium]|nr:transcriptional regulator [Chitinophagia bacterium]
MLKTKFRSICAIATGLDVLGDKWSLIIIRNMLFLKKCTYKELMDNKLVLDGIIEKNNHPTNKKVFIYTLTEKGMSTIPLIVELMKFSIQHYPNQVKGKTVDKNRVSYKLIHASSEQAFIRDAKKEYLKYKKTLPA